MINYRLLERLLETPKHSVMLELSERGEDGLSALEKMAINRGYVDIVVYFGEKFGLPNREAVQKYLEKRKQKIRSLEV